MTKRHKKCQITKAISMDSLDDWIEKVHAIENVFGMLNDLEEEQLETFETSIKRF
jgi:hypothetical protein